MRVECAAIALLLALMVAKILLMLTCLLLIEVFCAEIEFLLALMLEKILLILMC